MPELSASAATKNASANEHSREAKSPPPSSQRTVIPGIKNRRFRIVATLSADQPSSWGALALTANSEPVAHVALVQHPTSAVVVSSIVSSTGLDRVHVEAASTHKGLGAAFSIIKAACVSGSIEDEDLRKMANHLAALSQTVEFHLETLQSATRTLLTAANARDAHLEELMEACDEKDRYAEALNDLLDGKRAERQALLDVLQAKDQDRLSLLAMLAEKDQYAGALLIHIAAQDRELATLRSSLSAQATHAASLRQQLKVEASRGLVARALVDPAEDWKQP